ncbi:hypothetical protein GUY44_24230 [Pimelobacter simplex]|uniref:hypothetical protein n=1 Tax=Nocardioides simplex TaxID=2045 RepID=UPI000536125F|nr:hypothetical protein [Pimelobacter simplex]MCG8153607.1 hypothetical protein [Pimelobacter simplex]GEB17077.1 hypothetical protein NSI01_53920 [Pimelobacter simplex]SFN07787.1 hypothetical protein SAMN05421671_4966 [Pimelobacter simplex]
MPAALVPQDVHAARLALQQIITCQVVLKDMATRDQLIAEAVQRHGNLLTASAAGFITANTTLDVDEAIAEDRFFYILTRLGGVCELLADVKELSVSDVVHALASLEFEVSDAEGEVDATVVQAMQAAQTCLIANTFIRRGSPPWGIQRTLQLGDMAAVVQMLGLLLNELVAWFDDEHCSDLVKVLLGEVELILHAQAHAQGRTVPDQVAHYFARVMTVTAPDT